MNDIVIEKVKDIMEGIFIILLDMLAFIIVIGGLISNGLTLLSLVAFFGGALFGKSDVFYFCLLVNYALSGCFFFYTTKHLQN